jgi:hypothetical protein
MSLALVSQHDCLEQAGTALKAVKQGRQKRELYVAAAFACKAAYDQGYTHKRIAEMGLVNRGSVGRLIAWAKDGFVGLPYEYSKRLVRPKENNTNECHTQKYTDLSICRVLECVRSYGSEMTQTQYKVFTEELCRRISHVKASKKSQSACASNTY